MHHAWLWQQNANCLEPFQWMSKEILVLFRVNLFLARTNGDLFEKSVHLQLLLISERSPGKKEGKEGKEVRRGGERERTV